MVENIYPHSHRNDSTIPSSDTVGNERTLSDTGGQGAIMSPPAEWLTTDQIVNRLVERFDVKRDRRSAERYCQNGKVNAFYDDAQNIWFAEQPSVDLLGAQLKEIQDRRVGSNIRMAEQNPSQKQADDQPNRAEEETDGLYELRAKIAQLETEVKVKSELVNHLQTAREKDRDKFIEVAGETGQYKAEVKHLQSMLQISDGKQNSQQTYPQTDGSNQSNDDSDDYQESFLPGKS